MFNTNGFVRMIMWGGLATAILTGCNQPASNSADNVKDDKTASTDIKQVSITAIVEHPALDDVRKGIILELKDQGFEEGKNLELRFQSAQGSPATAGQISKQYVGENPDVIVAISTPSAQSIVSATNTIPVVFSAVTDPVTAKLVPNLGASGTNVTGATNAMPYEPQIDLMKEAIPNLKNVGYVYSPGEVNSTVILKNLKERLAPMGITIHDAPAQRSNEIHQAALSLANKVDMIYVSNDNGVVSAFESLAQVASENKIPIIAQDTDSVKRGAAVALGVNYLDLGRETGKIVSRILKGEKPGSIPIYRPQNLSLFVSPNHAAEQGFKLPQSVIDKADKVIE
ncbi:ABC transporter substrate-binding protein [Psychrobacter sp.]|uniref:ABC transporter substrate-binding protein n=1 Tax=Psychrobacter sp. TaxID=56811 RepID=UPI0025EBBC9C|nr:ABC transporter substrate-binding protein [Psychrobacter sp.]